MLGWVETHMGPGANERSNGRLAFGLFGMIAVAIVSVAPFTAVPGTAAFAIPRAAILSAAFTA